MSDTMAVTLPHMEVMDRLWQLPLVETAWLTSTGLYDRVKQSHGLAHWTLSTAEGAVSRAVETIAPVANRLATPIHIVDMKLCQGLDILEQKVPMVKEQPQQILDNAKEVVSARVVQPVVQTAAAARQVNVSSLRDLSWSKANELLESRYGQVALSGLDTSSLLADSYLDYYLPEEDEVEEEEDNKIHPSTQCEDKVLHTAHTVGRLSHKAGRRLYRSVNNRLRQVNLQNINEYLNSLRLVVHLTSYLNAVNQGVDHRTSNHTTSN
ncbi:lipid storage droplets surface-binding protein 2 isoform X2 [Homalodisca vitripennis]|uniref:lipid storage droplets surface-binding protein 2 isoform X2 n=1 Tax=Homalodisca vitripennis TaxID=197043 RepID=UPI001EEAA54D|nr:lipid storage droplets surface-binding protein 2 isoform X2 [Homalodisca vitripennis]